jgi:hypothetical protein
VDLEVAGIRVFLRILVGLIPDQVHPGKEMLEVVAQVAEVAEMQLVLVAVELQLPVQDRDLPRQVMAETVIK